MPAWRRCAAAAASWVGCRRVSYVGFVGSADGTGSLRPLERVRASIFSDNGIPREIRGNWAEPHPKAEQGGQNQEKECSNAHDFSDSSRATALPINSGIWGTTALPRLLSRSTLRGEPVSTRGVASSQLLKDQGVTLRQNGSISQNATVLNPPDLSRPRENPPMPENKSKSLNIVVGWMSSRVTLSPRCTSGMVCRASLGSLSGRGRGIRFPCRIGDSGTESIRRSRHRSRASA
jgi:hypothetical protein